MKKLFLLLTFLFSLIVFSQNKPAFWDDIEQFKKENTANPPPKNAILFLGSSSFTNWKDVSAYFPEKVIINRGFGGSSLLDLNFYSKELLKPYNPRQIVIYCGENDFAADPNLKPRTVLNRFKNFYSEIRRYYPTINVSYVSIKMSPSRENLWPKFAAANRMIKQFLARQNNTSYINITKVMNDRNGQIRMDLFLEDMLHMRPEGYRLWSDVMRPYLK